jgi:DNA invertase Pin-like site-specific DNA recombinase
MARRKGVEGIKGTAIYVRVSGAAQDTRSQEPDLRRWAEGREGVAWYRDKFTGRTMERPGFAKLLADVEAGRVGTVAVWRLDRLGRTAKGLTALFEDLRARGVNLVSLRDGLDLSTPAGRLMANVLASVAAYETEIRAERIIAGQAVARANGVRFGRPAGTGKRVKVTAEQEAAIGRLRSEGAAVAAIARATGLSRPTVYDVLRRSPAAAGAGPGAPADVAGGR